MSLTATSTILRRKTVKQALVVGRRHLSSREFQNVVESDVVIVGGGPAGLALASALGSSPSVRRNTSITLVEGGDLSKIKAWNPAPGIYSNRVVSLTNASQTFLEDCGSWNFVDEARTCAVEELQVWDGISDARVEFFAEDVSPESARHGMSRLTENFNLQRGLLRHLDTMPDVQIHQRTKVTAIDRDIDERGGWPLVYLDNDKVIRARLLVGADGFNSPVRSFAKIPSFGWSYNTQAIVATMVHNPRGAFERPNTTAYQRFLPTGPIAFLPLSPTVSSLVWSTKPALAVALLASDPGVLAAMINAAFRLPDVSMKYLHNLILDAHTNGSSISPSILREEIRWREEAHGIDQNSAYACTLDHTNSQLGIPPADSESIPPFVTDLQPGSAASFPLRFSHAESYLGEGHGPRTVLVGDAAHTVHPLAGQGLNLGLADVKCLAHCIEKSLLAGGDIGSYTALLPYAQERYLANHALMSGMDKLQKLYTTDKQPLVWARSVGVEVLNELDSIKAAIMMSAGAQARRYNEGSPGWRFAGSAVQTLAGTIQTAASLPGVLVNAVGSALQNLTQNKNRNKV